MTATDNRGGEGGGHPSGFLKLGRTVVMRLRVVRLGRVLVDASCADAARGVELRHYFP